ncbi:hypothetical protein Clacol_010504 [Clathrus columnatus]|uniref:DUF6593 domain-containing protein n=1 Tax=Clathrus columnatus TaxID=1419009 RepID=A0AAV5AT79_9AGAM|nr:hypothetical protein Clacol_010504 [Clathrus columnatus]
MLASLRAHPRQGVSSTDAAAEKLRARDLLERIVKEIQISDGDNKQKTIRGLGDDIDLWIELARLWENDNLEKTSKAYREALRISKEKGATEDPKLLNNIATLKQLEGVPSEARALYEVALTHAAKESDDFSTTILYNLARCYEDLGEVAMAQEAYEKLLTRHPEYVDAKIRQAQMLHNLNQINEAHELLKQALTSQSTNLNLRAYYIYFLLQTHQYKPAKDFAYATLHDYDKHDLYTLCATGYIMYSQARESRDPSPEGLKSRKQAFVRAAEAYERALSLDPTCAVAAQGLAIVIAEDALGVFGATGNHHADHNIRAKNAREALDIFTKVRESFPDGSVYANMGHCYYSRDEFERAIECYETASRRFYNGVNVPVLLSLTRSWYGKANKDQNYEAMQTALKYAQSALHLQPNDKAVLYNIAMIQQKAAELLFSMPVAKRSLEDLRHAIEQAGHAQKYGYMTFLAAWGQHLHSDRLFATLAADTSSHVPYNVDIADQRRKYGENMLRKGAEHLHAQEVHELEVKEKLDAARLRRQKEQERIDALERERMEQLRIEAEKLADERRKAREEALAWTAAAKMNDTDEEKEKKPKKGAKKEKEKEKSKAMDSAPVPSGDDAPEGERKRRRRRLKKYGSPGAGVEEERDEDSAPNEDGEESRPRKRVKKRVVRDEGESDEEGGGSHTAAAVSTGGRKKQYKSKELIMDSDEEIKYDFRQYQTQRFQVYAHSHSTNGYLSVHITICGAENVANGTYHMSGYSRDTTKIVRVNPLYIIYYIVHRSSVKISLPPVSLSLAPTHTKDEKQCHHLPNHPPIKLILTTNSLRNTTISDETDNIYYEIRTEPWIPLHTKVKRLDPETREYEVKAEIQRFGDKPEVRVLERSKEWASADQFLRIDEARPGGVRKKSNYTRVNSVGRFRGDDNRIYRWQVNQGHLELVRADVDQAELPVVIQHHHKRHFWVFRMSKHAWLEMKPEMTATLDSLILSYLLVERKRRYIEKHVGEL